MFNLTTYTSGAPDVNPDFLQVQSLSTIVVVDGLFSTVTNSNIQTHPILNVYPLKVIKACII
jgi:hypothetical protein